MELMAPAGSIESFIAAIEGGADSVYLGLKKYNARYPAQNFTTFQLIKVVNFAHSKSKKVYLTLNIDLKTNEIEEVVKILSFCLKIGIDAVIVKDLAIVFIYNLFFKNRFELHLSTQAAVCSSFGVRFAKDLNIERVVIARELTLQELKKCCEIEGIEIEVFVQGSMCFSISGRCLLSSYIGGKSSNRGRCTAPCRVVWDNCGIKKRYFSMKDLCLINHLNDLKNIGIKGLKIEGRLKNYNWVKKITSFYKEILDNKKDNIDIDKIKEELLKFSGRDMANGHILKHHNLIQEDFSWDNYPKDEEINVNTALFKEVLKIIFEKKEPDLLKVIIIIEENREIFEIKIPTFEKKKAKFHNFDLIKENLNFNLIQKEFEIEFINCENIEVPATFLKQTAEDVVKKVTLFYNKIEKAFYETDNTILQFLEPVVNNKRKRLLGDYPDKIIIDYNQINLIKSIPEQIGTIVVYIYDEIDINVLKKLKEKYNLIISIPPVLFEERVIKIKNIIERLYKEGFTDFEANSFCGLEILKNLNCNKHLGIGLPLYNHIATRYYKELGYKSCYSSIEGDISIFKSLANFSEIEIGTIVFGLPELFITRVESPYFKNGAIFSDKYIKILCLDENEIRRFVSVEPLSLISELFKKDQISIDNLTADLRFFKKPEKILKDIFNNEFSNKENCFNYFRKLS